MVVLLLLVPLAATSTDAMIRRLGGRRWRALHRIVYLAAPLAVLHFYMMIKADHSRPVLYGGMAAALLGWRLWAWRKRAAAA
jgi:sulfoxide reductase heme-binding subunit YedZ